MPVNLAQNHWTNTMNLFYLVCIVTFCKDRRLPSGCLFKLLMKEELFELWIMRLFLFTLGWCFCMLLAQLSDYSAQNQLEKHKINQNYVQEWVMAVTTINLLNGGHLWHIIYTPVHTGLISPMQCSAVPQIFFPSHVHLTTSYVETFSGNAFSTLPLQ